MGWNVSYSAQEERLAKSPASDTWDADLNACADVDLLRHLLSRFFITEASSRAFRRGGGFIPTLERRAR